MKIKFIFKLILVIIYQHLTIANNVNTINEQQTILKINSIGSRLGDSAVLPCGVNIKKLLPHDQNGLLTVPVLVNWFRHYSLTRKSDRPIYAKYLAHLIDYEPHIEREYENRIQIVDQVNLNISNLKTTDEGIYECKLIFFDKAYSDNQNGSLVNLQIYVAPEFENLSEEIFYLKPNQPIRLYCYARGKPTPTVTWFKNGKRLNINSSLLYEPNNENYDNDMIEYKCVAENIIDSIEHNIKVIKSGSLIFTEQIQNQTIVEGMLLNWPCVAQSNVDISYKWFKDSIAVQTYLKKWPDRGAVFQDGMLYLSETLRDDSGYYECHAYTQSRRVQSRAYLNVIYPPEIIDFDADVYALENSQTFNIDCNTKSNPLVHTYEWFKDDHLLSNNNKYFINLNGSLTIRHIKNSDHGSYYCTAQNTLKKVSSIKLNLNVIPNKKTDLILYASSGQNIYKILCKNSSLETKWYKIGSKLPKNRYSIDQNGQLNIINLNKLDTGLYLCIQENNRYSNIYYEKLIRLIIVENTTIKNPEVENKIINKNFPIEAKSELPLAPVNIRINQTYMENDILILWSYPEQTKIKIEYYQLNYRHYNNKSQESSYSDWITIEPISITDTSYSLNINDLIENEYYQIQMISCSIYSHSLPSDVITFKYGNEIKDTDDKKLIDTRLKSLNHLPSKTATFLKSVSQLDIILVAIFLFMVFILSICVLACIVYHRSSKYQQKFNKNPDNKDFDDWGFQSSSGGVTTTFLSSSPSPSPQSDKSSQLLTNNTIDQKICTTINCNMKNANYCDNDTQNSPNDILQSLNLASSINSESNSNTATILSSTNTNSTHLTANRYQRRSLILNQLKINNDNYEEEEEEQEEEQEDDNECTNWLNNSNIITKDVDNIEILNNNYSESSSLNTVTHLPQFKQNFSVCIRNSNSKIKRPIVHYPFKILNQDIIQNQDEFEFNKKIQNKYNSLKVDYV